MRPLSLAVLAALVAPALFLLPSAPAQAAILVTVNKSTQRMTVEMNGHMLYDWPVSTGKAGYDTPSGTFRAFRMEADHYSKEWDDAPMPHSIFFTQVGHAIHGTFDSKKLGTAASHGCVRLSTEHARLLFGLVKQDGVLNTRVMLTGEIPGGAGTPVASRRTPRNSDGFVDGGSDPSWWENQRARAQYRDPFRDERPRRVYRSDSRYYYGAEIAPRRYEYPDQPGRLYEQPRSRWGGDWGWR